MVKLKNTNKLNIRQKINFISNNKTPLCQTYPEGTTEGVFCQVQNFPRIVVLNEGYGHKKTLELNPCNIIGKTCQSCGFDCCDEPPFTQKENGELTINPNAKTSGGFDPNPPYIPPKEEQIKCYNLRSALNQCNINKRNFDYRIWPYQNVVYP